MFIIKSHAQQERVIRTVSTHPPRFLHFFVTLRAAENTLRTTEFLWLFPLRLSAIPLCNSALQKIYFISSNLCY